MRKTVQKKSRLSLIVAAGGVGLTLGLAGFEDRQQRAAYEIARRIPGTLNQLYCWCGCKEHSGHRALLECFESEHASQCDICIGEAMIAYNMVHEGVTDVRKIQDAIDGTYAPGRRTT